uniref:Uncharacterized protein n=1 Tax=Setaria italica TaxID=4555 RepID=K3Y773_SETIT
MTTTSTSPPSSTSPTSSRTARGGREHAATSPTPSLRGLQLRRDVSRRTPSPFSSFVHGETVRPSSRFRFGDSLEGQQRHGRAAELMPAAARTRWPRSPRRAPAHCTFTRSNAAAHSRTRQPTRCAWPWSPTRPGATPETRAARREPPPPGTAGARSTARRMRAAAAPSATLARTQAHARTSPVAQCAVRHFTEHLRRSGTATLRRTHGGNTGYGAALCKKLALNKFLLHDPLDYKPQAVDSGGASEDHVSNRFHRQFLLWVVLLTVLLSASTAYSAKNPPKQEGQCRYDLTSIAALSCMQKDAVRRPPSHACCKALLYAVDQVPVEDVSGACCLCRYMKEKVLAAGLATAYILCNGKDSRIVAKWSSFPITRCLDDCGQGNSTSSQAHGTGNREAHVSGMVIWVTVAVLIVIGVICFWYFRRFKAAGNAIQPRAGRRRRSVGPSSAKRKEKRYSLS